MANVIDGGPAPVSENDSLGIALGAGRAVRDVLGGRSGDGGIAGKGCDDAPFGQDGNDLVKGGNDTIAGGERRQTNLDGNGKYVVSGARHRYVPVCQ